MSHPACSAAVWGSTAAGGAPACVKPSHGRGETRAPQRRAPLPFPFFPRPFAVSLSQKPTAATAPRAPPRASAASAASAGRDGGGCRSPARVGSAQLHGRLTRSRGCRRAGRRPVRAAHVLRAQLVAANGCGCRRGACVQRRRLRRRSRRPARGRASQPRGVAAAAACWSRASALFGRQPRQPALHGVLPAAAAGGGGCGSYASTCLLRRVGMRLSSLTLAPQACAERARLRACAAPRIPRPLRAGGRCGQEEWRKGARATLARACALAAALVGPTHLQICARARAARRSRTPRPRRGAPAEATRAAGALRGVERRRGAPRAGSCAHSDARVQPPLFLPARRGDDGGAAQDGPDRDGARLGLPLRAVAQARAPLRRVHDPSLAGAR
jgi:hypothetical protein